MKSKFLMLYILFFFFQAEDGIRDGTVTGVQTCALPISVTSHQCAPPSERWGRPTVSGSWMMFTLCRRACTAGRFAASSVKLERSSLPPSTMSDATVYHVENLPCRPLFGQRRLGAMHEGSCVVTMSTEATSSGLIGCFFNRCVIAVLAPCVPPQHGQILIEMPLATSRPVPMRPHGLPRCRVTLLRFIISSPYTAA